jgi:hypothetical protein
MAKKKIQPIFEKNELETYLGRIFDYTDHGDGDISFETNYGEDEYYPVTVGKDFVTLENGGSGGGYCVDSESKPGFVVNDIDVLVEALDNACSEDYGYECF